MKAVIVTGSRQYGQSQHVVTELEREQPDLVIQGGATGADSLALWWAQSRHVPVETFRADWKAFGKSAGPIRNAHMADRGVQLREQGWEVVVLRFPGGAGTQSMERCAIARGLHVRDCPDPAPPARTEEESTRELLGDALYEEARRRRECDPDLMTGPGDDAPAGSGGEEG